MVNFNLVRTLEDGLSIDSTDNLEAKNTYQKGINGRLYSKNGAFSFSGGAGSKLVYNNNQIVKYLGFKSFEDEIIVFAKVLKTEVGAPVIVPTEQIVINAEGFIASGVVTASTVVSLVSELSDNSTETTTVYNKSVPAANPAVFEDKFVCDDAIETEIDFSEYYSIDATVPNPTTCSLNESQIPLNNEFYWDAIYSLKLDPSFNLLGTLLWVGAQNWPINGKITTQGVEENQFRKSVYYTDAFNERRVVNIKDKNLPSRSADEFNQVLNNVLLQPELVSITDGGQVKAMRSGYSYRIISENGQLSEFSPISKLADVIVENTAIEFRGGNISEITSKKVKVKCNIVNVESTAEIECIAIEYEAFGPPTSIRNLGRKPAKAVVEFDHFGNEAEFADNITFNDIIDFKNTWKYCNDFETKKNKLIAGGLRNEPIPTTINNLEYLFPIHSWNLAGDSHSCVLNPEPWTYRYVDPTNTDPIVYVKQKVYRSLSSFGPATITLTNQDTGDFVSILLDDLTLSSYTDITTAISDWLILEAANNVDFPIFFPNLDCQKVNNQLLFTPLVPATPTDMSLYVLTSNNSQYLENLDNDLEFLNVVVNTSELVYGGKSIGFDQGNGLRITFREFKEPLLNKANGIYDGTGKLIDFVEPSGDTYCMKGELYRIGLQTYNNDSTRYFTVPLGDMLVPNLGELVKEIDDTGNPIITSKRYVNQSVIGDTLYGHGIKMHIEVRLSCELQKEIPMYQIVYVERNEDNRTILCQGISAPLTRVQTNSRPDFDMPDEVTNKWNLPYYGGPTYEKIGLEAYTLYGQNDQYTGDGLERRVMTHRGLMYFDSPDLMYSKISDQYVANSKFNILAKLNTDHTPGVIRERGGDVSGGFNISFGDENYPKFSRKILEQQIEGDNHSSDLPKLADEENVFGTFETHFINVSVFSQYEPFLTPEQHDIQKTRSLARGEVISGSAFDVDNDVSNNTFALPCQPWYYSGFQRKWDLAGGSRPKATMFSAAKTLPGYNTTVIKTSDDVFTSAFIGPDIHTVDPQIRKGANGIVVYDTIPLVNLYRNNRESVFGGRTEQAYSANTYIALSKTIPVLKSANHTQYFDVGADVYVTLNIRTKNDYGDGEITKRDINNDDDGRNRGDINVWERKGAWTYACVLETQVEPKLTYQYEFYRVNGTHSFDTLRPDFINPAYFNVENLKSYIPKPFKFRDDPNRGHVIAVSDVKLAGEVFDSWTVFKTNNFYSLLEKNKGDISNLIISDDNLFAIQANQTSLIYIGMDRIIPDQDGGTINVQQGSGTVVDGHKILSSYGTAIRRASIDGDFGFIFFDETKVEFVKNGTIPLLVSNLNHLEYWNRFKNNPIIDSEAYYDHENKESCIRLRTVNGDNFMMSYNEIRSKFNGDFEYDNDLFMMFNEKVFAPITNGTLNVDLESNALHQINEGDILSFFGVQKELTLGIYVHANVEHVILLRQWGAVSNIDYPFKSIFIKSNLGYDRTILGSHQAYDIREGTHTVPAINDTNEIEDSTLVRGGWIYIEMTVESLNKNKVDILAVLNSLRISHL